MAQGASKVAYGGPQARRDEKARERMRSGKREMELVGRMIAGEETAFDEFSEVYIPRVYRFAANRLKHDRDLVGELVQTTFCRAIAKLPTFKGRSSLTTWLCAVCKNEIAAHYRRLMRRGREVGLDELHNVPAEAAIGSSGLGPEVEVVRREETELVHLTLDSLPPHYGRILEWKYLQDLSVDEIAGRLELGSKAAESLLTRARNSFRKSYDRLGAAVPRPSDLRGPAGGEMRVVS